MTDLADRDDLRSNTVNSHFDVIVVGGGAAGMSAAITLGRARRSVLVVDAGKPRNAPADGVHNYLGSEGVAPADLIAGGRVEAAGYGVRIVDGSVTSAERSDDGTFRLTLDDASQVTADRVLVTTGLVDALPDVPGLAQRWGRDVLHCPYCHGWEVRDKAIGILGTGPFAVHHALLWRQWSKDVTLFLHTAPRLTDDEREQLDARGVLVIEDVVTSVQVADDRLTGVLLDDGRVVARDAIVVATTARARADFLVGLGLEPAPFEMNGTVIGSHIPSDPVGATDVAGVWVAGNVTNPVAQVIASAAAGVMAAAAINGDLIAAEVALAVAERRPV